MRDTLDSNSIFERPIREMTAEEIYQKGQVAAQLLHNPVFRDALQEAEYSLSEELLREEYPVRDADGNVVGYRDPVSETYAAKKAMLGLRAVEGALRAFIADGEETKTTLVRAGVIEADD
jgi:hypothetical protein